MNKYGGLIRELREKNSDSLEDLANKLDISLSALSKIELGQRGAKTKHLEKIAEIYEVPLSYFFGEEMEVPEELKELGVEWIKVMKNAKDMQLTPEQVQTAIDILASARNNK